MTGVPLLAGLLALATPPATLSADLDGDGQAERVVAEARGKKIRIDVQDAAGRRVDRVTLKVPRRGGAPRLSSGSIGSAGAVLEVTGSAAGEECRSLWRLRNGRLWRLPLHSAGVPQPDCAPARAWSTRWENPDENAPAVYVKEKTRSTERGPHVERQVFRFSGFSMEHDRAVSSFSIAGVTIPSWYPADLYTRRANEILHERFDFSPLRNLPRARIEADGPKGLFQLRLRDGQGEVVLPVVASSPGAEPASVVLEAETGPSRARLEVKLANREIPVEARLTGAGPRFDEIYVPVNLFAEGALRVFTGAEEALASEGLAGSWSSDTGEKLTITNLPGTRGRIRIGAVELSLEIDRAPAGLDLLLVPADGSPPPWGLDLRGPDRLERVPVLCAPAAGPCRATGSGNMFRRIGARLNVR